MKGQILQGSKGIGLRMIKDSPFKNLVDGTVTFNRK